MEQLPINSFFIDFLQTENFNLVSVSLRIIGNICSGSKADYVENLYKNGLLEALTIAWHRYHDNPDVEKECVWMLSNISACRSEIITKAILNNQFFTSRIKAILDLHYPVHINRREVLYFLLNVSMGYSIELTYMIVA